MSAVGKGTEVTGGKGAEAGAPRAPELSSRHRMPALDGLRGLAIIIVLFNHLGEQGPRVFWRFTEGGIVGVDVFFVLSGFLITSLLVAEWDHTGSIALGRFYMRRALRLLPALFVMIGIVAIAAHTSLVPLHYRAPTLTGIPYALLYATDLRWVLPGATPLHAGFMDPMWSLSIEEQFYLLWPGILLLVLMFVPNARQSRALQLTLIVAALIQLHRALLFMHGGAMWDRLYATPDTHTDGLLIGCALAFIVQRRSPSRRTLAVAGAAGLATVLVFALFLGPDSGVQPQLYMQYDGFGIVAVASAFLLWSLVDRAAPRFIQTPIESRTMRFVGRISYALYLWNYAIFIVLRLPGVPALPAAIIRLVTVFAVATASYYLVERYFLRIKLRRWSSPTSLQDLRKGGPAAASPATEERPLPGAA
ncbi:MAG TPA: acyltransferase [Actinomycetota bacterium]|nr:acyltransferase [Actinomycetota bacterium]